MFVHAQIWSLDFLPTHLTTLFIVNHSSYNSDHFASLSCNGEERIWTCLKQAVILCEAPTGDCHHSTTEVLLQYNVSGKLKNKTKQNTEDHFCSALSNKDTGN